MQQALRSGGLVHGDPFVSGREAAIQTEDDLGFAAALRVALPAGLAIWALLVAALVRLVF